MDKMVMNVNMFGSRGDDVGVSNDTGALIITKNRKRGRRVEKCQ